VLNHQPFLRNSADGKFTAKTKLVPPSVNRVERIIVVQTSYSGNLLAMMELQFSTKYLFIFRLLPDQTPRLQNLHLKNSSAVPKLNFDSLRNTCFYILSPKIQMLFNSDTTFWVEALFFKYLENDPVRNKTWKYLITR
jgi:hypothetical protein